MAVLSKLGLISNQRRLGVRKTIWRMGNGGAKADTGDLIPSSQNGGGKPEIADRHVSSVALLTTGSGIGSGWWIIQFQAPPLPVGELKPQTFLPASLWLRVLQPLQEEPIRRCTCDEIGIGRGGEGTRGSHTWLLLPFHSEKCIYFIFKDCPYKT